MFTGGVGRIRLDVDVVTAGALAKIAALERAIEKIQTKRGPIGDLFKFDTKSFKQLARESDAVYQGINGLVTKSYFLQSAISALVPVVAQLVGGLFALGSQAAAAGPALIVLPGIMTAMMQAAITAKLALGGVFKAVGELGKAKTPAVDQMPAKLEAFRGAQERVRRAQEALNRAYREAAERIQQLGFDTEDAAIAQERAALALEDARATLARVQDLPPNSRARQEAELAFKEADLNYRRAIDRSNDLTEEQDRVTKNGTLNADEQVNQSEEVLGAQEELRKSLLGLKKAQDELNKSQSNGGGLTEFNKLSKAAQEFATYLAGLKPEIQKLKDAAGEELFGPLQAAIKNLVDNFFPRLVPLLRETGKALGNTALDFSKIATEANNLKNFETVGKTNIDTIGKLGKVVGNLFSAFISLLAAADPLVRRFTDWVVTLTGGWKATSEANNQSGKLAKTFEYAGDVASQLGDIIGNLGGALMNMGRAASGPGSGGEMIFDAMEKSTKKFKDFTKKISEDGSLEEYFRQSATGFLQVFGILGKIIKIVLKSATQPGTKEFLDSISRAVDHLGKGFEHLSGTAPYFGKFIEGMARLIAAFTESGSIIAFFRIMNVAVTATAKIFENETVAAIFKFLAAWHGAKLAILALKGVLILVGKYMLGMIRGVLKPFTFVFKSLRSIFMISRTAAVLWTGAIAAIVAIVIMAYKYSEKFRKSLSDLGKTLLTTLGDSVSKIKKAFDDAFGSIFKGGMKAGDMFKDIGDFIAKFIVPIIKYVLVDAIKILTSIVIGVIKLIAGIAQAFVGVFKIFKAVFKVFTGDWGEAWSLLKDGVITIFAGLWKSIKAFFAALPALIAGFLLATTGPLGQFFAAFFGVMFMGFAVAIRFVWNKVIKPIFMAIGIVLSAVWNNVLKPVFGLIAKAFGAIAGPAAEGIGKVFSLIGGALGKIGGAGLKGLSVAFSAIATAAGVLWKVLNPVLGVVLKISKAIGIVLYVAGLIAFTTIGILIAETWRKLKKLGVAIWQNLIYPFAKYLTPSIETVIIVVGRLLWPFKMVFKAIILLLKIFVGAFVIAFRIIKKLFEVVFPVMVKIAKITFNAVGEYFKLLFKVMGIVLRAYIRVWKFIFKVARAVFEAAWDAIKAYAEIVFKVMKIGFKLYLAAWKIVIKAVKWVFENTWNGIKIVFDFVWERIKRGVATLWDVAKWVFGKVLDGFKLAWEGIQWIFENVWPKIWGGIKWAWENLIKPIFRFMRSMFINVFEGIQWIFENVWPKIWGGIKWAWENLIKPVFDAMGEVFGKIWNGIKAVFDFVWPLIRWGIEWAWNTIIKPIFDAMGVVFGKIWNGIKAVFDFVWPYIHWGIQWAWDNVIKPTFDAIGVVFDKIWNGIKAVFDPIWNGITGAIGWAWDNVIKPVAGKIGEVFGNVWNGIKTAFGNMWENIKLAFTDFPQFIKNVFNGVISVFNKLLRGIVDAFKQIPALLGKVWGGVVGIFKGGVNLIIKGFNKVLGGKKFTVPKILGGGTFGFDKIPELGSGDDFNLEQVVTGGYRDIPGLALGGTVYPRSGGTLVKIAEAGRPERVEPLDPDGLSKRDKAMIAMLAGGGTGGITINVHPSPGMNEVELAALVNRQLAFELRKGAA